MNQPQTFPLPFVLFAAAVANGVNKLGGRLITVIPARVVDQTQYGIALWRRDSDNAVLTAQCAASDQHPDAIFSAIDTHSHASDSDSEVLCFAIARAKTAFPHTRNYPIEVAYRRVYHHPDFLFGSIFTKADFADQPHIVETLNLNRATDRLTETGWDIARALSDSPR